MSIPENHRADLKTIIDRAIKRANDNEKAYWFWWLGLRMAAATCSIGAIVCAAIVTSVDGVCRPLNAAVVILTAVAGALTGTFIAQFDLSEKWSRWSRLLKELKLNDLWLCAENTEEHAFRQRLSILEAYEPENSSVADLERLLEPFPLPPK